MSDIRDQRSATGDDTREHTTPKTTVCIDCGGWPDTTCQTCNGTGVFVDDEDDDYY